MRKFIKSISFLLAMLMCVMMLSGCRKSTDNDDAQKDKKGRYLAIVNGTGEVINEIHVLVDEGCEIESMAQVNPDEESMSIQIPKEYAEYDAFEVIMIDCYGFKYQKKITEVNTKGVTVVKIEASDYVKQSGDWWKSIVRFFNGNK